MNSITRGKTQKGILVIDPRKEILLVEDDPEMRSLLCDGLWDLGYPLKEASDGDEALREVIEKSPVLIVTDLKMPAGGLDYLARLRKFAPSSPIIVMTSFGDAKTKEAVFQKGATAYFDKPLRLQELKEAIVKLLGRHAVSSEGAS